MDLLKCESGSLLFVFGAKMKKGEMGMDLKELGLKIAGKIEKDWFEYQAYEDYYGIMKALLPDDMDGAVAGLKWLSETISDRMAILVGKDLDLGRKMMGLHKRVLLAAAPWDFDSYLLYIEWNRQPEAMFYRPRRFALKPLVDALMDLVEYDKIDKVRGMDIVFVTSAKTDEEARELLRLFNMPFAKNA